MKKLPIGISDFKELITNNYIYVDKTKYIYEIINSSKYIFISRPRRFGKSLLLSTIEYLYEGYKDLFNNLYIQNIWDWNKTFPVIKIDLSTDIKRTSELYELIYNELEFNYNKNQLEFKKEVKHLGLLFKNLIIKIYQKYNKQTVILIDEYDKPILDVIENKEEAEEVRKTLKEFYSVLKGLDKYIKFVMVSGVSKFAKVSLFSGLNQLKRYLIR